MGRGVELRVLPVDRLFVDGAYQRGEVPSLVAQIVSGFDSALLGVPEVSERNGREGPFAIVDGQQRITAVRRLGAPAAVRCNVHRGLTLEDEAWLFVHLNKTRRQVAAIDRFLAEVFYGASAAVAIRDIAAAAGFQIGKCKSGGPATRIEAVATLEQIYGESAGAEKLATGLNLLAGLWLGDPRSNHTHVIRGITYFAWSYRDVLTAAHKQRLAGQAPAVLLRRAYGRLEGVAGGSGGGRAAGAEFAELMRKAAGIRKRAPRTLGGGAR